jgi:hypothetical protein
MVIINHFKSYLGCFEIPITVQNDRIWHRLESKTPKCIYIGSCATINGYCRHRFIFTTGLPAGSFAHFISLIGFAGAKKGNVFETGVRIRTPFENTAREAPLPGCALDGSGGQLFRS